MAADYPQPAALPDGARERGAADDAGRPPTIRATRLDRRAAPCGWHGRVCGPEAAAALGRPAAAGRDRLRAGEYAQDLAGRRADRRGRLADRPADPGAAARPARALRPDDRDRDP